MEEGKFHLFTQKIFTKCLLCTRNCSRYQDKVVKEKDKNPALVDKNPSMGEVNNKICGMSVLSAMEKNKDGKRDKECQDWVG